MFLSLYKTFQYYANFWVPSESWINYEEKQEMEAC